MNTPSVRLLSTALTHNYPLEKPLPNSHCCICPFNPNFHAAPFFPTNISSTYEQVSEIITTSQATTTPPQTPTPQTPTIRIFTSPSSSPRPAHEEWDNVDDFDPYPVEESSDSPSSTQSPFTPSPSPPEEIGREEITNEFADSHRNSSDIFQKMGLVDLYFLQFS